MELEEFAYISEYDIYILKFQIVLRGALGPIRIRKTEQKTNKNRSKLRTKPKTETHQT
jgi:hypothetical protein